MKFQSGIASVLDRARRRRTSSNSAECSTVQELLSVFMDAETSPEETAQVEAHMNQCLACRKELQSLTAVRNFVASSAAVAPPENLALEARLQLSRARHNDYTWRINFLISDWVKPLAIRAVLSASVTAVLFGVILLGLLSNQALMASDQGPLVSMYQPVRPTESAKLWLAGTEMNNAPEPLLIEAYVDEEGHVYQFRVIEGTLTPEVDRWVWERLYYAPFSPATSFGQAVPSSIILSFVAVES